MLKVPDFAKPEIEEFRKKYPKLRFNAFEMDFIKKYANLTEREEELLEIKNRKEEISVERCAELMQTSVSTVTRTTRDLVYKIIRVFKERD